MFRADVQRNKHLTWLHIPFSHQTHQGHIMVVVFLSYSRPEVPNLCSAEP